MDLNNNDYLLYTVPPAFVAFTSTIFLIIQRIKSRKDYDEILQEDIPIVVDDTRFSTVKRDLINIGIIILQIGALAFLFGYRYDQNWNDITGISAALLVLRTGDYDYTCMLEIETTSLDFKRTSSSIHGYRLSMFALATSNIHQT
ncbi:12435_t:CDS:2 [Acaulospora colombiana]|uniref:12435_t:CDS:1 n=1 Tax=Acaulospora colombiana TaxID=27376 RepID=A0ACA9M7Z9_9GLOM|nr:12435_t:CDS:2 [Acaulospora colombiana]